ncbi:MAG TPA: hypothetical protein V6C95_01260 [Coleofasciculaceae cyanobacterium]
MASPFFSGRIPQDLYDKIKNFADESGKSKTEILIEALSAYLNCPVEIKKPARDEELWDAIKKLQERVTALEGIEQESTVIETDNSFDNKPSENNHGQLSLLEEMLDNKQNDNESIPNKVIKTNEVPSLPGLENRNPTDIKTQLRNAKSQGRLPVKIGHYLLDAAGKEPGKKGSLLWKVLSDNSR